MQILIAEDEAFSRILLQRTLGKWGFETTAVVDGQSALDILLAKDGPAIALLDWHLPKMSGVEICRIVRQQTDLSPRYIIMLTASTDQESVTVALESGADLFLGKPYELSNLKEALQKAEEALANEGQ